MNVFSRIIRNVSSLVHPLKETTPEEAYNIWSTNYDNQHDNLMLDLDQTLFTSLHEDVSFQNKIIADVGCGTGRHWNEIYKKSPAKLKGYDVSQGMLKILKKKFPLAETYHLPKNYLQGLSDKSCDIIICTLAIAHIQNVDEAFAEWNRILKPGAHIIITDYHPVMLAKGGDRTFIHNGKKVAVKNYIHPLKKIRAFAQALHLKEKRFEEIKIDATVKHYYEKQKALHIYERFKGTPVIYGMHLIKEDVTA